MSKSRSDLVIRGQITTAVTGGRFGTVNRAGIDHYNKFIDALLRKGIQPFLTLNHHDIPQELEDRYGAWLSPEVLEDFACYAEICFRSFGGVKYWTTFNEPNVEVIIELEFFRLLVALAHLVTVPEEILKGSLLLRLNNEILSHAAAVTVYRNKYQKRQGGSIGIVMNAIWYEPISDSLEDKLAAERDQAFYMNWFLDPIIFVRYPAEMQEVLGLDLPTFSNYEQKKLRSRLDFISINHYTSFFVKDCMLSLCKQATGASRTEGLALKAAQKDGIFIGEPTAVDWLFVYPTGMQKILAYIKDRYNNTPMFITENGFGNERNYHSTSKGFLNDVKRVEYMSSYLGALSMAVREGADVRGYFSWSLLDNFEWISGYTIRFGLYHVDFTTLERTQKTSATWYKEYIANHKASTTTSRSTLYSVDETYMV